jgi:hypothetical protein
VKRIAWFLVAAVPLAVNPSMRQRDEAKPAALRLAAGRPFFAKTSHTPCDFAWFVPSHLRQAAQILHHQLSALSLHGRLSFAQA